MTTNALHKRTTTVFSILILLCCFYFYFGGYGTVFLYSDSLEIPSVFIDLIVKHHSLSHWSFSPNHYAFPDAVIFFITAFFFKNLITCLLITSFILLALYYFLLVRVGCLIAGKENVNFFRLSALLSLTLASTHNFHAIELLYPPFNSHFSSTLIGTLSILYCVLKLIDSPNSTLQMQGRCATDPSLTLRVLLFLLCFLFVFSDPLPLPTLMPSLFIGLFFLWRYSNEVPRNTLKAIFWIVLLGMTLGHLADRLSWLLPVARSSGIQGFHFLPALLQLKYNFTLYFQETSLLPLVALLYFCIAVFLLLNRVLSKKPLITDDRWLFVSCILAAPLLLSLFLSFFDADIVHHYPILSHFQEGLILSVFLGIPLLLCRFSVIKNFLNRTAFVWFLLLLIYLFTFGKPTRFSEIIHLYPPLTQCLDTLKAENKLANGNGISNYADARYTTFFSKKNLNIVSVNEKLEAIPWMSTSSDYLNKTFYYVIVDHDAPASIDVVSSLLKSKPSAVYSCADRIVLVFAQGFTLQPAKNKH